MDAMFHRSSIRKFQNRPVEEAKIRDIKSGDASPVCRKSAALGILYRYG